MLTLKKQEKTASALDFMKVAVEAEMKSQIAKHDKAYAALQQALEKTDKPTEVKRLKEALESHAKSARKIQFGGGQMLNFSKALKEGRESVGKHETIGRAFLRHTGGARRP